MRRALVPAVLAALLLAPAAGAWTWPSGGAVLQPFVFDPSHPYAGGQHRGLDLGGDPGSTVVAPAAGTVTFAGSVPSSGKSVTIETADGYSVTLTHLGSITVAANAAVSEGAPVGTIGPSGDPEVAQPYVHLGVRLTADAQGYLDPSSLLPPQAPAPPVVVPAADPPPAPAPAPTAAAPAPDPAPDPAPAAGPAPVAAAAPIAQAPAAPAAGDPPVVTAAPAADEPPVETTRLPTSARATTDAGPEPSSPTAVRPALGLPRTPGPTPAVRIGRPRAIPLAPVSDPSPRAADVHRPVVQEPVRLPASARRLDTQARRRGGASLPEGALALLVVLPLALCAAGLAAARRKSVPIMELDALLRDDTDLLRERQAAHRACVHDDRRRHPRAASSPARRGDVLPHRRRRARDESLAGR